MTAAGPGVLPEPCGLRQARGRMRRALEVARCTPVADVPVGAVVFAPDGSELACATNRREADADPTAHAEVLALRAAAAELRQRAETTRGGGEQCLHGQRPCRLEECELVVTLEPCTMCAGALTAARVGSLVFGAFEPKTGACGSIIDVVRDPVLAPGMAVRGGILDRECAHLLEKFFTRLRKSRYT